MTSQPESWLTTAVAEAGMQRSTSGWVASVAVAALAAAAFAGCTVPQAQDAMGLPLGPLDKLHFAVVGAGPGPLLPAALASRIWQGVEDETGHPHFAIATGDVLRGSSPPTAEAKLQAYLLARARFRGPVFFALGGQDGALSPTLARALLASSGQQRCYYAVYLAASDRNWTAKLVFVAEDRWDSAQEAWLRRTLNEPSTYTFVVRHRPLGAEGSSAGSRASAQILAHAPYTLLLAGDEPRLRHDAERHQLVMGHGVSGEGRGVASLGEPAQYGYVVARQRSDGAMVLTAYDYDTHATAQRFAVRPDGGAAVLF